MTTVANTNQEIISDVIAEVTNAIQGSESALTEWWCAQNEIRVYINGPHSDIDVIVPLAKNVAKNYGFNSCRITFDMEREIFNDVDIQETINEWRLRFNKD